MLTFPTSLPRPVWGGQPLQPEDTRVITPTERGIPRIRRRSALVPTTIPAQWTMTDEQKEVFLRFVEVGLQGGVDAFTFPVYVGSSWINHEVVLVGYPQIVPTTPGRWSVQATMVVKQRLGLPVYRDLSFTDANDGALTVGSITGTHTAWRCEIYIRTGVNAGTSATLKVGHTTDDDAFVTSISVATAGQLVIVDGHGNDGALLGASDATSRTVTATLATTGTAPTEGDLSVCLFWRA